MLKSGRLMAFVLNEIKIRDLSDHKCHDAKYSWSRNESSCGLNRRDLGSRLDINVCCTVWDFREQTAFSDRHNANLFRATLQNLRTLLLITTAHPYCARNACLSVTPRYASSAIAKEDMCTIKGVKKVLVKRFELECIYKYVFIISVISWTEK